MSATTRAAHRFVAMASALLLSALAIGCRNPLSPGGGDHVCTRELRVAYSPADTTISVGESFVASVALSSCGGGLRLQDAFTWEPRTAGFVHVQAATGRITAIAPGETWVAAVGQRYGRVGEFKVTVR